MGMREDAVEQRFQALVVAWLETLPAEGWAGTSKELGNAIASSRTVRAYVPMSGTLAIRDLFPAINAAGWDVAEKRTKAARLICFSRR